LGPSCWTVLGPSLLHRPGGLVPDPAGAPCTPRRLGRVGSLPPIMAEPAAAVDRWRAGVGPSRAALRPFPPASSPLLLLAPLWPASWPLPFGGLGRGHFCNAAGRTATRRPPLWPYVLCRRGGK